jgi:hypothetical protein
MNRRISDLLDAYHDDSVELSGPTPLSSARIKELTMNKINGAKTVKKAARLTTRLLAAAAVIAALTVSALAVNYAIGAGGLMQNFFTQDGEALSTGQIETLDQIGQTFEGGVTDNGATITPLAALADDNCCYLRLRVEAPEGTVLPDLEPDSYYQLFGGRWPEEELTLTSASGEDLQGYTYAFEWQPDSDPADNVKEVVIRFTAQGTERLVFSRQEGIVLTIPGLWVQSAEKAYTPVFTGHFALTVGRFERRSLTVDCGGADHVDETGLGFTVWLDRIELSPLSISMWFRDNVKPDQTSRVHFGGSSGICEGLQIVLKDGTVAFDNVPSWKYDPADLNWDASTMLADGPINDRNCYAPFGRPLDLDQVDYIKFGDHIISVHAD